MAEKVYWARRPMLYCGTPLDRGQVVLLSGGVNDERLLRLEYLAEIKPGPRGAMPPVLECGQCGAKFVDDGMRTGHGEKRHRRHVEGIAVVASGPGEGLLDVTGDAEERYLEQVAPLRLDKTEASLKA